MSDKVISLRFNVPSLKKDLLTINWKKIMTKNDYYTIYDAVYEGIGPVSVIPMYNLDKNLDSFPVLTNQINKWKECKIPYIAQLYGIIPERDRFILVFERLSFSLSSRLNSKSLDIKDKFSILLDVIETLFAFNPVKERILDLRINNIFLNERSEARLIFPCGIIFNKILIFFFNKDLNHALFTL